MSKYIFVFSLLFFLFIILSVFGLIQNKTQIKETMINSKNLKLFLRIAGNPDINNVLIVLNGGPGQSSHYMSSLEKLAGQDLAVVSFDQRGTGRSENPKDDTYTFDNYIDDIEAIRLFLKQKKIHLLGHSFGGILAQYYVSKNPTKVKSLILVGTGPPVFNSIREGQIRLGKHIQNLVRNGVIKGKQPVNPVEFLRYILPAYFSNPKFPIPADIIESSYHPHVVQKTYNQNKNWDFREEVKQIRCPVLFIWGEDDPFGVEMANISKKALVNAKMKELILKKCGHFWHEKMGEFLREIKLFLTGIK